MSRPRARGRCPFPSRARAGAFLGGLFATAARVLRALGGPSRLIQEPQLANSASRAAAGGEREGAGAAEEEGDADPEPAGGAPEPRAGARALSEHEARERREPWRSIWQRQLEHAERERARADFRGTR